MTTAASIDILGPLDLCRSQQQMRRLSKAAELSQQAVFRLVIAVTELSNHLFLTLRRRGRLALSLVERSGRSGLEVLIEVEPGPWAVDLPMVESWVDELHAGFDREGRILVKVRQWAAKERRPALFAAPLGLGAGPRPVLAKSQAG